MDYYDPEYNATRYEPPTRISINIDMKHPWQVWRICPLLGHTIAGLFWLVVRDWAEIKVEDNETNKQKNSHYWRGTRNLANRKARTHGKYFEIETTLYDFRKDLGE